jgi:hypothetical protein
MRENEMIFTRSSTRGIPDIAGTGKIHKAKR